MEYRGWDRNQKKFIKNFCIYCTGAVEMIHENEELKNIINEYYTKKGDTMWGDYEVLDFTDWYGTNNVNVDRSTEDLDQYKTLIYENDIVRFLGDYYTVKFKRGSFLLESKDKEIWWHQLNLMDVESSMEIVGNIYEQRKTKLNILNKI